MDTVMNKKEVLSIERKVTVIRQIENGKKKADMCRELCLLNSAVETIWGGKKGTKIISAFKQNGSRVRA
jgi:hypothetical protein